MFTDDSAVVAHSAGDIQSLVDSFTRAASQFGLSSTSRKLGTAQRNVNMLTCGSMKLHLQGICCHRFCQARLRACSDTVLSLPDSNAKGGL